MKRFRVVAMAAAVLFVSPAFAQDEGDVPEQGVARLSLINGDVKVQQGDSGQESAGVVNAPVLTGDRVFTSGNARAEIQFDYSNMIRMGPMAEVQMGQLADRHYEIQLRNGLLMVRVMSDNQAQFEIDTPSVSVRPAQRGTYRIEVMQDGSTEITVRSGQVEIFSPQGSETLRPGQTMMTRGDAATPEFQVIGEVPRDEFDQWSDGRDREMERSVSSRYVPSDVYGTESLDSYGSWSYDAPYGYVWTPRVDDGWAPYRQGRWSYVNYYGWTWISSDPWGWAPYHYGRWYQGARGWSWYPGAMGSRYYWRPALVGFFGWGSGGIGVGFGSGFGFGNVGWVPLAPYESYRPWYGRWGGGGNRVNIVNNVNVVNVYRNARFDRGGRNGITSVRGGDFGRGFVNNNNFVRAGERDLRNVGDIRGGGVPFQPGRDSRRFSDRNVNNVTFPQNNNRQVFRRADAPNIQRAGGQNAAVPGATRGGFARPGQNNPAQNNANAPIFRGGAVNNRDNNNATTGRQNSQPVQSGQQNGNRGWRTFDPNTNGSSTVRQQQDNPRNGGFRNATPSNATPNVDRGNVQRPNTPSQTPNVDRSNQNGGAGNNNDRGGFRSRESSPNFQNNQQSPRMNMPQRQQMPSDSGNRQRMPPTRMNAPTPVQISPQIVRSRPAFSNPPPSAPRVENRSGGFGAARPASPPPSQGGGMSRPNGGGGGQAPRSQGNGGGNGNGNGGGNRGGGGRR